MFHARSSVVTKTFHSRFVGRLAAKSLRTKLAFVGFAQNAPSNAAKEASSTSSKRGARESIRGKNKAKKLKKEAKALDKQKRETAKKRERAEMEGADFRFDQIENMPVSILKKHLGTNGLKKSGKKHDLVERLKVHRRSMKSDKDGGGDVNTAATTTALNALNVSKNPSDKAYDMYMTLDQPI